MNDLTATLNAERTDDHRRARRGRAGDRGAGRPARRADRDARRAGPARRGRHPGDPGEQGRPAQDRSSTCSRCCTSCTRPATSWRPGSTCWSASRSPRRPPRSSRATTPTPRSAPRSASTTSSPTAAASAADRVPPIELPDPGRGAHRRAEVPAERQPDQQGLPEGARRRRPAQQAARSSARRTKYKNNPVCAVLNAVPDVPARRAARRPRRRPGRPASGRSLTLLARSTARRRGRAGTRSAVRRWRMTSGDQGPAGRVRRAVSAVGIVYITASYLGFVDRVLGRGHHRARRPCRRPAGSSRAAR